MSLKRTATSELNHDNWDKEEASEEAGTFVRVAQSELKNRVIKKAKRSLNKSDVASNVGSSPFAKFGGFTKNSISMFSQNPLSALSNTKISNFSTTAIGSNGDIAKILTNSPMAKCKTESSQSIENNKSSFFSGSATSALPKEQNSIFGKSSSKESKLEVNKTDENKKSISESKKYLNRMQGLNESVIKFMQDHMAKNKCSDFTPAFKDYIKYMDKLNVQLAKVSKNVGEKTPASKNTETKNGNTVSRITSSSFRAPEITVAEKQKDETDYGAHFNANTTNTSTFSFGISKTPTATSTLSAGPTSSSKESPPNDASKESETSVFAPGFFSMAAVNSNKSFSFVSPPTAVNEESENNNDEDEPPKNEFTPVTEDDALYSKRCKLFYKKGSEYCDRGIGTLFLKKLEGKTQLLIRADTNLGNILLNIMLNASLPMSRTGKNNVLVVCIPNPPIDPKAQDSNEAVPMLIRVKTAEDADELLENLNKYKV